MVSRPGKYQPRFTSGELDALFSGNTDQGDYYKGAALMRNVRPFPQGGFGLMPGSRKLARARTAAGGAVSPISIRPFTRKRDSAFDVVFTDGYLQVYGAAGLLAEIASPFTGTQAREMSAAQELDTALLCHPDVQPQRLKWNGADANWLIEPIPFRNIPDFDYGGVYTNGVAAVWTIDYFNAVNPNKYVIAVNGQDSTPAVFGGGLYDEIANLTVMLTNMPGLNPGWTVTKGPASTPGGFAVLSNSYAIEFSGADNKGDGWAVSGRFLDNAAAAITAAHARVGVLPGEPIMSVARGWPGAVLFYGGRVVLGGFKSAPNYTLPGTVEDLFNLDTRIKGAAGPFLLPLNARGAATILHLHYGRTLVFFTDGGEYWLATPTLDKTAIPTIASANTNVGARADCRPVDTEGGTLFVAATGGSLHEFRYDFNQQNYAAPNIAVRASSLVRDIRDIALRKPQAATDTAQLYAVRQDGVMAVSHVLVSEEIRAFTRRETAGAFKAVCVNDRRETTLAVVRNVGNAQVQFIEREAEAYLLDGAQDFSNPAPVSALTGLEDFEGQQVWVIGDNVPQGPFTVAGGGLALNWPARNGYVGRWTPPRVLTLPQPRGIGPNTVMRRPCRVHTVRLRLHETSSVAIGANGLAPIDVPLTRYGELNDIPLLTAPFSGEIAFEGLQGFSDDGVVEITQKFPGKLNVLGLTIEVDL